MSLRPFQIVLFGIFAALAVAGLVLLATFSSPQGEEATPVLNEGVEIWGTLPVEPIAQAIRERARVNDGYKFVQYRQIDSRTFEREFVDAVAEGRSPDLLLISNEDLVALRSKLYALRAGDGLYDVRSFRNTYVDGAEIFVLSDGLYAYPMAADVLVMYWNRDLFAENGLVEPPVFWSEINNQVAPAINTITPGGDISESAIAFGDYQNIRNAVPIILTLSMQSGSRLISENSNRYEVNLNLTPSSQSTQPFTSAINYFSSFSNINSPLYSWNRAQPLDRSAFVGERLALYFGMASELLELRRANPNLNYDVAPVPQGQAATVQRTYGKFYGLAIPRGASNPAGATQVMLDLSRPELALPIATELNLAPVARQTLAAGTQDPFREIIYDETLTARGWLAPDPEGVAAVFRTAFDDINAGRKRVSQVVGEILQQLALYY